MKKLLILSGLPGSGKSTWARKIAESNKKIKHLELDICCIVEPIYFSFRDALISEINKYYNKFDILIVDFIFYSKRDIASALSIASENFNFDEYQIHHWLENRNQCLINDSIRKNYENREYSCSYTIKNTNFYKPDLYDFYNFDLNIKLENHNVYVQSLSES